jgi:hypothetical protein
MSGDSDVTVVTFYPGGHFFRPQAAGASNARHSLRPLVGGLRKFVQTSDAVRRENADARHCDERKRCAYASNTASAPLTPSALSITVRSSAAACTVMFSAKNLANVT